MGRKSTDKLRINNPTVKSKWIDKLMPLFMQGSLHDKTMDVIAQKAGVSKATFYKYYASKKAVLWDVVQAKVKLIAVFHHQLLEEEKDYKERYFNALQTVSKELTGISNSFLIYLQKQHLEIWQLIDDLLQLSIKLLGHFYEEGVKNDQVSEHLDTNVLAAMDSIFLTSLMNPQFLVENNIPLETFIEQYFLVKSKGIFKEKK